ncbi:MAG: site-specific integrase [Chitinophagaceae bacterium]
MKTTNTFGVQFIIRIKKTDPTQALIYARITVNSKRLEISLKRIIDPLTWLYSAESVKGTSTEVRQLNKFIEETRYKLRECYQELRMQSKLITAEAVKNLFLGEEKSENTLCSLMDYHNENMNGVLAWGTLKNYFTTKKYVLLFLKKNFKTNDIYLSDLSYQFITEFEFFLRKTIPLDESNPLGNNGIMKHIERLKKIARLGVMMEWMPKHPFERFRLRFQKTERDFLTTQELTLLENFSFSTERLNRVKDLFVFSCYTGLAYIDLFNLTPSNLCIGIDGEYWIKTFRQKTEVAVNVPLLPQALKIIEKYKNDPIVVNKNALVPLFSNQKVNQYLKDVAKECKIQKYINFHLARHTFATTVTLTNGVPIETVSKMLGHTKLSTTQVYVHILQKKISDDMNILRKKFKDMEDEKKLHLTALSG